MIPEPRPAPRVANGAVPDEGVIHRGQLRIAYRLAAEHDGRLLHVHSLGWHHWDGTRWAKDTTGVARRAVYATLKAALGDMPRLDRQPRSELLVDVSRCESDQGVKGVLGLASAMGSFPATVNDLDTDPYLLNCSNGTLDLRTTTLRRHTPADRITKKAGAAYHADATSPEWDQFLTECLPSEDVRSYVQRLIGHAILGKVVEHVLPIFTGTGRNGKGVALRTIQTALGDYAIEAEPELLMSRDRAHPTGQMDLRGIRLAVTEETEREKRLAVATVKRLTGGDRIRARAMRQDFVEFLASHQAILVTNHLPVVPADDSALWARLHVVPWEVSFLGREDTSLDDRLGLHVDAVLAWAVTGYRQWTGLGRLNPPPAVTAATMAYRLAADTFAQFVEDRCEVNPHMFATARQLWDAWQLWARKSNAAAGTERAFRAVVEGKGYRWSKGMTGAKYTGLGLSYQDPEGDDRP